MRFPLKHVVLGLFFGILLAAFFFFLTKPEIPPIPTRAEEPTPSPTPVRSPKQVIGFYPYWNLSKVNEVDLSNLTTIYYFALDLNSDGSWNKADPGWSKMGSNNYILLRDLARKNGVRWGVTIVNLSADSIARNINNPIRQQTIIDNTVTLMKDQGFQDLNIDLEYVGGDDEGLKQSFTMFTQKLTNTVHQEIPGSTVSIDFISGHYKKPRIYDFPKLGEIVDQVIIMGYDFHRINSTKAGPVAPMFGKTEDEIDISKTVDGYLKVIPKEKLILGVPFYGYEWPTETNEKDAFTIYSPRGPEISSYNRSIKTAKEHNVSINFDDVSKSVWFPYFDNDYQTWRQVWFENERSLGVKFDLVNALNLEGIAIFALGYDGANAKPLWDEVKLKLK